MSWNEVSPELRALIEEVCTAKQLQVMKLQAGGLSTRGIASVLDVDRATVRGHLKRAHNKLRPLLADRRPARR